MTEESASGSTYYFVADSYNDRGTSSDSSASSITVPYPMGTNMGFEAGTSTGWNWTAGTFAVVASNAHGGTYAAKATGPSSGVGQVVSSLLPSTTYTLTAWAKNDTAGETSWIGVKNYGGTAINETMVGTGYTEASLTFTTGAGNTSAEFYLWKSAGTGSAYADDFLLQQRGPTNYLDNPGLESGSFSTWWSTGSTVVASNAHSGTYAGKVTGPAAGFGRLLSGVSPNTTYTATAWIKNDTSGESADLVIADYTTGNTTITSQAVTTTGYSEVILVFTTGPTTNAITSYAWKYAGTGSAYFDDFTVSLGLQE